MRLRCFGIVLVVTASVLAGRAAAQIPEHALFQPGSYAYGPYTQASPSIPVMTQKVLVEVPVESLETEADDTPKTAWETNFTVEQQETTLVEVEVPVPVKVKTAPYLAWHRDPITHRIHVVPYQPGYAASPDEFPKHQSKLNLFLSSLPCRTQDRAQVKYASYYDPDPEIVEDKPSRMQLILGYPNGAWTSGCVNRWGHRMAQCPGVVPVAMGSYAEVGIKDQLRDGSSPVAPRGGLFRGPRPLDFGPATSTGTTQPCQCEKCLKKNAPTPAPPIKTEPDVAEEVATEK